jgi:hypothetical protein
VFCTEEIFSTHSVEKVALFHPEEGVLLLGLSFVSGLGLHLLV